MVRKRGPASAFLQFFGGLIDFDEKRVRVFHNFFSVPNELFLGHGERSDLPKQQTTTRRAHTRDETIHTT